MKILKPLPHAVIDYAWAGAMMAAPWIFGFRKNKAATINSISSGAAILGLSLMTRYPLGAIKLVPFPVHGAIESVAGALTATAPWLMGFERDKKARWVHLVSGLSTFAVVAMTDYNAAERGEQQYMHGQRGAGMAEQLRNHIEAEDEKVDLGPPTHFPLEDESEGKARTKSVNLP